jgi:glycosyltransferase involved in cell wall biosynthesis
MVPKATSVKLSIIIPAYQEESTIGEVLRRVAAVDTESLGFDKEIVVCDDGSQDRTSEIVRQAAADDPRIVLVTHTQNQGKGAAIRTALARATGDYCLIQDADLEYEVADYPALLRPLLDGARVVYGSRFLANPHPTGMKTANYVANRALAITANLLYGLDITDEATCFKVFETDLLRSLELECTGFEFCPEVTAKLGDRKVPIVEVPIQYQARSVDEGKKVRWTDGVEAMWVLVKHRLRRRRGRQDGTKKPSGDDE